MTPRHARPDDTPEVPQVSGPGGAALPPTAPGPLSASDGSTAVPVGSDPGVAPLPAQATPADGDAAGAAAESTVAPDSRAAGDLGDPGEPDDPDAAVSSGAASRTPVARRSRAGRQRRGLLLGLLGLLVVAVVVAGVSLLGSPGTGPGPAPTPASTGFAQQRTLLIQVRNDAEVAADNMITAVGGGLPPAQVLVPSRLIVDVPGAGQQTLGASARLLDRSASQDALSDLLALRIDGTLSLGRLALAGMVDYVGGITLTVDTEITEEDKDTGARTVVVPMGTVHLNGSQAATYALTWLPEETETDRLARFSDVMTATISSLPDDQVRVEAMLTSLGGSARTTIATSAVATYLLELRSGILAGGQLIRVLPTSDFDSGGSLPVVRVDLAAADVMLNSIVPQAMLPDVARRGRVLVQNGLGTPGLGAAARDRLVAAGLVYINGGNAEEFGRKRTRIILADGSAERLELGAAIAKALEVDPARIRIAESGQNVADAVVILGADFQP